MGNKRPRQPQTEGPAANQAKQQSGESQANQDPADTQNAQSKAQCVQSEIWVKVARDYGEYPTDLVVWRGLAVAK